MKRTRESLTGGTGDVNPQILSVFDIAQGSNDTDGVLQVNPQWLKTDDYLFAWIWDDILNDEPPLPAKMRNPNIGFCEYNFWDRPDDFTGQHTRLFDWKNGGGAVQFGNRSNLSILGPNQAYATKVSLPVPKMGTSEKKATVIEALKVWFYNKIDESEDSSSITLALSTRALESVDEWHMIGDPAVFAAARLNFHFAGSLSTGADVNNRIYPIELDLTDGAGHGVLIASDSIFAYLKSSGTGVTNTAAFKMLYRYKTVGVLEYVGIVQSQS